MKDFEYFLEYLSNFYLTRSVYAYILSNYSLWWTSDKWNLTYYNFVSSSVTSTHIAKYVNKHQAE